METSTIKKNLTKIYACEIKYGYQCAEIAEEIKNLTGKSISAQTIKRICGLLPYGGQLRAFTSRAIEEFIYIKYAQLDRQIKNEHINPEAIVELLNTLAIHLKQNNTQSQQFSHLYLLRFIYKNRPILESHLLELICGQPIHDLWWFQLPPMEMTKSSILHWLVLLKNRTNLPERLLFYDSFLYQFHWLQKKKIVFDQSHFKINTSNMHQWDAMIQGRFYQLYLLNFIQNNQLHEMEVFLRDHLMLWQNGKKRFCSLIQLQLLEFMALNNQWKWTKIIMHLNINSNHPFHHTYVEILHFWKKILFILEKQRSLDIQFEWNTIAPQFFFAPKYYELIFTSVLLKGKYLRDFHLEKFNKRKMELIQETGYQLFKHWPNVSEFKKS